MNERSRLGWSSASFALGRMAALIGVVAGNGLATGGCAAAVPGDGGGEDGIERTSQALETCVTLSRGLGTTVGDAHIRLSDPTKNWATSNALSTTNGTPGLRRGLIKFDLASIPANTGPSAP